MQNHFQSFSMPEEIVSTFNQMVKQWQTMIEKQASMTSEDAFLGKEILKYIKTGQETFLKLWSPFIENVQKSFGQAANGNFQAQFEEFQAQVKQHFQSQMDAAQKSAPAYQDMWNQYIAHFKSGDQQWIQDAWKPVFAQENIADPAKLYGAWQNAMQTMFDKTAGNYLDSPSLGLMRNYNEKVAQGFKAYTEHRQAEMSYQNFMQQTWAAVYVKMAEALLEKSKSETPLTSFRDISRLWSSVADEVFIEAFKSKEYVNTQRELLESTFRHRKTKRELVEIGLRAQDLPTLTDVDDLIERVYALKKENRQLKAKQQETEKRLQQIEAALANMPSGTPEKAPAKTPAKAPAKKSPKSQPSNA